MYLSGTFYLIEINTQLMLSVCTFLPSFKVYIIIIMII